MSAFVYLIKEIKVFEGALTLLKHSVIIIFTALQSAAYAVTHNGRQILLAANCRICMALPATCSVIRSLNTEECENSIRTLTASCLGETATVNAEKNRVT
jgi:hypothetical protein